MFLEPSFYTDNARGWIEVVCGPMFSGKTEELIRRLKRAQIAKQKVAIFKPKADNRYSEIEIVSHNRNTLYSVSVENAEEILTLAGDAEVIGIDEAQFFSETLVRVAEILALKRKRVIIAGLDLDYRGRPFSPVPMLMAIAEYVTKVHAVCVQCGMPASHSYRLNNTEETVMIGETESYEPRCRFCFNEGFRGRM